MNKRYTPEQDDFIRANYSSAKTCTKLFNERFGTNLSYHAIKGHAQNILKLRTDYRIWNKEMNGTMEELLKDYTYREATAIINEKYGLNLCVKQVQTHCKKFGIARGTHKPWTDEMKRDLADLIKKHPYKKATELFNAKFNRNLTVTALQRRCNIIGINREFHEKRREIDTIIKTHIDKPYKQIKSIISEETNVQYKNESAVCVRANNLGLNRPHRVWHVSDKRFINGTQVSFSEFVRFIGNRWHRLPRELHETALMIIKLQATANNKQ